MNPGGWLVFGAVTLLAACRPGPGPVPPLPDRFSQLLVSRIGAPRAVPACQAPAWDLGPTAKAHVRRYHVGLHFPPGFVASPSFVALDPVHIPGFGQTDLEQWRDGLYLAQPGFYRWSRAAGRGVTTDPDAPEVMFQMIPGRGYPLLHAAPPWTVAEGTQCTMLIAGRPARVITFRLMHPSLTPHWGVTGYWRGRPDDGWFQFLGLGPEPASQAELLAILRAIEP